MELQLMNERRHNKIYNDESYTYKIFNIDYDKKDVFQEAFITSKVEELDAHAPLIDSVYKKDGQWCIKFDLIKGESLFSLINNNSENIEEYINKLVTIQTSIHTNFCTAIPRQKAKLQYGIKNSDLDESTQFDLLEMLDSSPKHKKLCHGNLTPHNIIISGDDYCVLDWNHASQGNASADIARTYIWFKINMPEYAELYLDSFCNMTGTTKRYVNQWLPIVAAARIYKDNPGEFDILKSMIKVNEY
ncbi:phosphotransferase [uncultured Eubacterium sp.]|uniref:phosphotransferase n=1 Tax=Eubacterium sp. TaxID=142586 RepID=UPI003263330F